MDNNKESNNIPSMEELKQAPETSSISSQEDFEFVKEKIKERPINKRKLAKRTIVTATLAVVFGRIACLTFLLLEPVVNNWLYPEEKSKTVSLLEEEWEM